MRTRRWPFVTIALIGLGLALAPVAFKMFDRAPKGGDMIKQFRPYMTTAEIDYRGVTFPVGSIVLVSAWHANRDGQAEDEFDLAAEHSPSRVLTFGAGIHYCVGANLARAEMQEALAFVAERVEAIALDGDPDHKMDSPEPSAWPFWSAVAISGLFIGSVFSASSVEYTSIPVIITRIGWYWPKWREAQRRKATEVWSE